MKAKDKLSPRIPAFSVIEQNDRLKAGLQTNPEKRARQSWVGTVGTLA